MRAFHWWTCVAGLGLLFPLARPNLAGVESRFLFAWTMDADAQDSDFLAVLDVQERPKQYGRVVATLPVGEKDLFAHHIEHDLGPTQTLFASGFAANRVFLFNLRNPLNPTIVTRFGSVGPFSYLHSFARTPNNHVIATFQGQGPENAKPGGLAELDESGRPVRWASLADPTADQDTLRPYSLAVVPTLDRIVVGLTLMPIPASHPAHVVATLEHDHRGNQIQVWRLSDLTLIKTIRLAEPEGPNEPRVLGDGRTVLVNTSACRLYRVDGLDSRDPSVTRVFTGPIGRCNTPVVVGNYWVQANTTGRTVFSLDVSDLGRVRLVSTLSFDQQQMPHWLATDGRRIIVVNEETAVDRRLWMTHIDPNTGILTLDERFRNEGSSRPGFSFDGPSWPHGRTGSAIAHGTVFGR